MAERVPGEMERERKTVQSALYGWPFFVAMGASLLLFCSFQALFPTLPLFTLHIGGTPADNGLNTWVFALAALLARPVAGTLADRWGRKPILVIGAACFGVSPLLCGLAPNVWVLFGARAVHGIGLAFFSTGYQTYIADMLPAERLGRGLGLANAASSVAMAVAPLGGERIVQAVGFRWGFAILGLVGLSGMGVTFVLPRGQQDKRAQVGQTFGWAGLREALRHRGVLIGVACMAVLGLPFGVFITFLPLWVDARELGSAGAVFAAYALTNLLVRPLSGRLVDRWSERWPTLLGLSLAGLAGIGLAEAGSRWTLAGMAALLGAASGVATAALDAMVQRAAGAEMRGVAAALQYTAFDLVIGFGSLFLGQLAGVAGYGAVYRVAGFVTLMSVAVGGLVLAWRATRPRRVAG